MDGLRDVVALRKYVGVARLRCSLEVEEDEVVYQRNDEYYVPMSLLREPWIRSGLSIANITAYRSGVLLSLPLFPVLSWGLHAGKFYHSPVL